MTQKTTMLPFGNVQLPITRGELYDAYKKLSNQEKDAWGTEAGYQNGYRGLYRYLSSSQDEEASTKKVKALVKLVGVNRFETLLSDIRGNSNNINNASQIDLASGSVEISLNNIAEFNKKLIQNILSLGHEQNEIELIEKVRSDYELVIKACTNKIDRIKIERAIQE